MRSFIVYQPSNPPRPQQLNADNHTHLAHPLSGIITSTYIHHRFDTSKLNPKIDKSNKYSRPPSTFLREFFDIVILQVSTFTKPSLRRYRIITSSLFCFDRGYYTALLLLPGTCQVTQGMVTRKVQLSTYISRVHRCCTQSLAPACNIKLSCEVPRLVQ